MNLAKNVNETKQEKKVNFYGSDEEFLAKKLYPLERH